MAQWRTWIDLSPDAHVFFEPCLVQTWYETYRELRDIEPRFLVASQGSDRTVFFPIVLDRCRWKDGWLRVLRPVGYNEFDYHDPVCSSGSSEDTWAGFWRGLRTELPKVGGCDHVSIPRVREQCAHGIDGFRQVRRAPFIELSRYDTFEGLLSHLSSSVRQDIRRKMRRLEKQGALRLRVFGREEVGAAAEVVPRFLEAHGGRWPKAYHAPAFYERLVACVLPQGVLHMSALLSGTKQVSWHIGFFHKKRFYWYVPVFDASISRFSPGLVHLAELVDEAMRCGASAFDFLVGQEEYKSHWTRQSIGLHEYRRRMSGLGPRLRSGLRAVLRSGARALRR